MSTLVKPLKWITAITAAIAIAWLGQYHLINWLFPQPAAPDCPYSNETLPSRNAGCLLLQGQSVLLIEHASSGKWDFPGGTLQTAEAPRCTAFRESFEETGLTLEVGNSIHIFENDYELFRCHSEPISAKQLQSNSQSFNIERIRIQLVPVNQLTPDDLRFPAEYLFIIDQLQLNDNIAEDGESLTSDQSLELEKQ